MTSAEALWRRTRAVELRRAGFSYDDIGIELGYANCSGAWKAAQAALKAVQSEAVNEYRALNEQRLEALLTTVWDAAMDGDLKAVAAARRIVDAENRMLELL